MYPPKKPLFSVLLLVVLLASLNPCSGKLKIVTELYRHGARGSLSQYYDGDSQGDISGELTATGQRQHYNLGTFLREEYIINQKFMPEHYNHSLIHVRADDFNRTIMSAYSHFQGFYPIGFGDMLRYTVPVDQTYPPYQSNNISTVPDIESAFAIPSGVQVNKKK